MRPKDEYIAAAFREACDGEQYALVENFIEHVDRRARELQQAAENPARTTCKTCGGMMVNPRPCGADNCGFKDDAIDRAPTPAQR